MEHYSNVRQWLLNTAHRILPEKEYNAIMAEVARLESVGARGELVVHTLLSEIEEKFFELAHHIIVPEESKAPPSDGSKE